MEKLVFVHHWGDEASSGTITIPFEYPSLDEFKTMLKINIHLAILKKEQHIKIFDVYVNFHEKYEVLNLEEWFNTYKEKIYAS